MTWIELRKQITELGFNVVNYEYEDIYEENKDAYIFSVNRAIEIIATTVRPILGEYVIRVDKGRGEKTGFSQYNIRKLAGERFYDFAFDIPMIETADGDYKPLVGYQTQKRGIILIPNELLTSGIKAHIWYKKKPTVITEYKPGIGISIGIIPSPGSPAQSSPPPIVSYSGTPDDFEIELDHDVLPLVPLLASHWIWLDDEPAKAAMYWNEYDVLKNQILQNSEDTITRPRLENTTGWWD